MALETLFTYIAEVNELVYRTCSAYRAGRQEAQNRVEVLDPSSFVRNSSIGELCSTRIEVIAPHIFIWGLVSCPTYTFPISHTGKQAGTGQVPYYSWSRRDIIL